MNQEEINILAAEFNFSDEGNEHEMFAKALTLCQKFKKENSRLLSASNQIIEQLSAKEKELAEIKESQEWANKLNERTYFSMGDEIIKNREKISALESRIKRTTEALEKYRGIAIESTFWADEALAEVGK